MEKNKVKAMRVQKGITQEEARKHLNISINAYRNKEAGRTRWHFDEVEKLSEIFNIPIQDFSDKKGARDYENVDR